MSPDPVLPVKAADTSSSFLFIRPETPADRDFVADLQARAFGPGRFARAAFRVRERFSIDESLSLIAEIEGVRAASVWMTPIGLSGQDGYLLGPLATDPAFRKRGAGRALVTQVCARALARGAGAYVLLVGDAPYYGPLGFAATRPGAIRFPGPVDPTRILVHAGTPDRTASFAKTLAGELGGFGAG